MAASGAYASLGPTAAEAAPSDVESANECRICRLAEDQNGMVRPCTCVDGWVHRECLMKWIEARRDGERLVCEVCHTQYNVRFASKVRCDAEHACSCSACGHCTEGIILVVSLVCMLAVIALVGPSMASASDTERAVLIVLLAATVCMSILALVKVYRRWHRAASVSVIV